MDLRFRSDWDELPLRCDKEKLKKMESTRQSHYSAVCEIFVNLRYSIRFLCKSAVVVAVDWMKTGLKKHQKRPPIKAVCGLSVTLDGCSILWLQAAIDGLSKNESCLCFFLARRRCLATSCLLASSL